MAHLGALEKGYEGVARHRAVIAEMETLDPITEGTVSQLDAATATTYTLQPELTLVEERSAVP